MLGVDNELEQLYEEAQQNKVAILKARWTDGNYGCCSTRAPLVEKYRIEYTPEKRMLYLWGKLVVTIEQATQQTEISPEYSPSNYEKKVIAWFSERVKQS
ncbi:hypothetical protein P7H59_10180 [Enterococcus viikkiensis]|uniref:Uncharacterized protein n=1 Tax=Enterococcus viikkiensis TaxID=930854 RepID=A0ABU3FS59_9ENTE|nr:hypothetical protein [Enterococcus viikkiensis]MDT2828806.1 hypothetical protein [Enterococcus viikkiensis]